MFVDYITLDHTRACMAEPGKIVVVGKPSGPNAMLPNEISYNPRASVIVLRRKPGFISPLADLLFITQVKDADEGLVLLDTLRDLLNQTWERRDEIEPRDEERTIMHKHSQYAYDMLSPMAYLRPALDIPYCHHEKWDGTGYPRGLKGEQIPLAARLFATVDVWDALRSDRPYRQGWSEEKVIEHIKAESGTHFDPPAVDLFLRVANEKAEEHQVTD